MGAAIAGVMFLLAGILLYLLFGWQRRIVRLSFEGNSNETAETWTAASNCLALCHSADVYRHRPLSGHSDHRRIHSKNVFTSSRDPYSLPDREMDAGGYETVTSAATSINISEQHDCHIGGAVLILFAGTMAAFALSRINSGATPG